MARYDTAPSETPVEIDTGTAYGMGVPSFDPDLIEVEAGTPTGEMLRRYWHPFAVAADATGVPKAVRVLGEDLILFRDGQGRPGLVHPRCCHRGTTLYYGKVEDDGIRCCYHGWRFDVDGTLLEAPGQGVEAQARLRERVKLGAYPAFEYKGLVFAYLCLLYTSPSPRDKRQSRMPSSA